MRRRATIASIALALAACSSGIDDRIRAAHARFDALTPAQRAELDAFCAAARRAISVDGYALVDTWPRMPSLIADVPPTTLRRDGDTIELAWWNNSHAEEDDPHPSFEVVCSPNPPYSTVSPLRIR